MNVKDLFIEKYGDITELRKEKVLPKYISGLKDLIRNPTNSEKETEFQKIQLFLYQRTLKLLLNCRMKMK